MILTIIMIIADLIIHAAIEVSRGFHEGIKEKEKWFYHVK